MLLKVSRLVKNYFHPESGEKREVLRGLDFSLDEAQAVAIVGPSGSGKSTLLHILGLLDSPGEGEYVFKNEQPLVKKEPQRAQFRNREIGFVFQAHYLLPQFSVLENVLLPVVPAEKKDLSEAIIRARDLLSRVGLADREASRPTELSGGECQRVAFVRALINAPSLVLADEPTGSLDSESAAAVVALLCEINRFERSSLIVVTHSTAVAAAMNKTYRLQAGVLAETEL